MIEQLVYSRVPQDRATRNSWILMLLVLSVGAALRFWGLGNIGLHGDEEVMGLATRGILETGSPILPSGMYYPRALPQLYLMAGSVYLFGDTEWALRLPSALTGTFTILVAFWLGRRFLAVRWSIVFAAIIAILPEMVALSQTARMYVFYVTFVMLFAVAVFRWERTGSIADLSLAVLTWLVALSFHTLTAFAALLFFYPGILKASGRMFAFGVIAFAVCIAAYKGLSAWIGAQYFELVRIAPDDTAEVAVPLYNQVGIIPAAAGALAIVLVTGIAFLIARQRTGVNREQVVWLTLSATFLSAALVCALLIQYHLAGLAFIVGAVICLRSGASLLVPAAIGTGLLALLGIHALLTWQDPAVENINDLIEALAGLPNPLPYLTFLGFAPAGIAIYVAVAAYFVVRFARGYPLPDHGVLFLLAVFFPLFFIGFFAGWYVPGRYLIGFLPFFVLATVAGVLDIAGRHAERPRPAHLPVWQSMAAAVILIALFVSPTELRHNVNPQYADFPYLTGHRGVDHKGAAEFVLAQRLGAEDLVIAVDAQQQSYYLRERLDYYLRALNEDRNSSIMRNDSMLNLYTGTPQIATGRDLAEILSRPGAREILIVGSGEITSNRMRYMDNGIWQTMREFGIEEVYAGRDGATKVWRYVAAASGPEQASRKDSGGARDDVKHDEP